MCSLTVFWGFKLFTSASVSWVNSISALLDQSSAQTKLFRPWAPRMPRSPKHTPRHSVGRDTQWCLWVPYNQVTYGVKSSGTCSSNETRTFSDSFSLGTPRNAPSPPCSHLRSSPTEASLTKGQTWIHTFSFKYTNFTCCQRCLSFKFFTMLPDCLWQLCRAECTQMLNKDHQERKDLKTFLSKHFYHLESWKVIFFFWSIV